MSCELQGGGRRSISPIKLVATATSLEVLKKDRSPSYGQRSTSCANFVKIGPVDVEIIDLIKITKIYKKQQQNLSPPRL